MPGVRFLRFLNTGVGQMQRSLGEVGSLTFIQNGVELQFEINAAVHTTHRNLRPVQWAGPEAVWIRRDNPLDGPWSVFRQGQGTGPDDPLPESILTTPPLIAYYDSPGPNMTHFLTNKPTRVYVVQNFTGWIVGEPVQGGQPEPLCPVVAWHSILNLGDSDWNERGAVPRWFRLHGSRSALGWGDTSRHPTI
jgi:hypothetical protein